METQVQKRMERKVEIFEGDENPERGNWSGKLDFLLSCLGFAVGLGNVWRFPYLCYKNGGGAFLVPYTVMLFCLGLPIFLMELTLGQFSAMAPITLFRNYVPGMRGVGIAMLLTSSLLAIYYNVIVAWSVFYTYLSMTSDLPWQYCDNDFNTVNCFSINGYEQCKRSHEINSSWWIYNNGRCISNASEAALIGVNSSIDKQLRVSSAEEYFDRNVLASSDGIENMGQVQVGILISLLVTWLVVCASLIGGIKSSGKVVYFTALFPYVVLTILLVRGVTLPGAYEGIQYYIVPEWNRLTDVKIWQDAAIQIFYSLSLSSGGLITLSSYNRFHNNIIRDTLIVCFGNCLTSVYAGFAIFSVLGFMARELDVPVSDVVTSGPGLAFVAYPDLVTRLPYPTIWALLFFLMLFTLGLDSEFTIVENLVASLIDELPVLRPKKSFVVVAVCFILFLFGIPFTMQGGRYLLELIDIYVTGWPLLFFGLCKINCMYWVYGIKNFLADLCNMTKFRAGLRLQSHMVVVFGLICPLILSTLLLLSWIEYAPLVSGNYVFPHWANVFGITLALVLIALVPLGYLYNVLFEQKGSLWQRVKYSLQTTERWYEHSKFINNKTNNLHYTFESN